MQKIESLTEEQIARLPEYRDRWVAVGLSTNKVSLERAIELVHPLQTELLGRKATPVVILDNPLHAWLAVALLSRDWDQVRTQVGDQVRTQVWDQVRTQVGDQVRTQVGDQVWAQVGTQVGTQVWAQVGAQVRDQVGAQVWAQVGAQVWDQVGAQVRDQVGAQVWAQVGDQVWAQVGAQVGAQVRDQVGDQVGAQVWAQVGAQVRTQVGDQVRDFVWPWLLGSFESGIFSFYEFFMAETDIRIKPELLAKFRIWRATSELGLIYPLENICVVSQKPTAIRKNEYGLHCDGGKALEYEGWGFYALNGVVVPEYLAMTPSEELDITWYHRQENADVRSEFVRKYGVERMLNEGKKVDTYENYDEPWWTKSQYELWDMACLFSNLDYQPYLKMLNQTTGIWHVEAVSPASRTLGAAIKERFGGRDFSIRAIA